MTAKFARFKPRKEFQGLHEACLKERQETEARKEFLVDVLVFIRPKTLGGQGPSWLNVATVLHRGHFKGPPLGEVSKFGMQGVSIH